MPTLRCGVTDCSNNKDNCCCNNEITVGGLEAVTSSETTCKNFDFKSGTLSSDVRDINPSLYVNCSVTNCAYNKGQMCTSKNIEISMNESSYGKDTECATFVER